MRTRSKHHYLQWIRFHPAFNKESTSSPVNLSIPAAAVSGDPTAMCGHTPLRADSSRITLRSPGMVGMKPVRSSVHSTAAPPRLKRSSRSPRMRSTRSSGGTQPRSDSRLVRMRCGRLRRPTRSTTRPTSPRCRSSSATPTSLRPVYDHRKTRPEDSPTFKVAYSSRSGHWFVECPQQRHGIVGTGLENELRRDHESIER